MNGNLAAVADGGRQRDKALALLVLETSRLQQLSRRQRVGALLVRKDPSDATHAEHPRELRDGHLVGIRQEGNAVGRALLRRLCVRGRVEKGPGARETQFRLGLTTKGVKDT